MKVPEQAPLQTSVAPVSSKLSVQEARDMLGTPRPADRPAVRVEETETVDIDAFVRGMTRHTEEEPAIPLTLPGADTTGESDVDALLENTEIPPRGMT